MAFSRGRAEGGVVSIMACDGMESADIRCPSAQFAVLRRSATELTELERLRIIERGIRFAFGARYPTGRAAKRRSAGTGRAIVAPLYQKERSLKMHLPSRVTPRRLRRAGSLHRNVGRGEAQPQ